MMDTLQSPHPAMDLTIATDTPSLPSEYDSIYIRPYRHFARSSGDSPIRVDLIDQTNHRRYAEPAPRNRRPLGTEEEELMEHPRARSNESGDEGAQIRLHFRYTGLGNRHLDYLIDDKSDAVHPSLKRALRPLKWHVMRPLGLEWEEPEVIQHIERMIKFWNHEVVRYRTKDDTMAGFLSGPCHHLTYRHVSISSDIIMAAAADSRHGQDLMQFVLRGQVDKTIPEAVVISIISMFNADTLRLLLDNIEINDALLIAAAGNWHYGSEVMDLLLHEKPEQAKMTEEALTSAAGNWGSGREILTLLLEQKTEQIQINEAIFKAAAGNLQCGKEVVELLLEYSGDQAHIAFTKGVLKTVVANPSMGVEILELLWSWRNDPQDFSQISITDEMLRVASRNNGDYANEILDVVLVRYQQSPSILPTIWNHFDAESAQNSKDVFSFICEKGKVDAKRLDRDILSNLATSGNTTALEFLSQNYPSVGLEEWLPIASLYNAASTGDIATVTQLLNAGTAPDSQSARGMTPLAIAARNGHEYVVKALVNSRSVDLDSTCDTGRTPMSWAMLCGHHKIVKVLSLAGAYESIPDYHGTSAQSMQEGIQNLATVTIEHQSDA